VLLLSGITVQPPVALAATITSVCMGKSAASAGAMAACNAALKAGAVKAKSAVLAALTTVVIAAGSATAYVVYRGALPAGARIIFKESFSEKTQGWHATIEPPPNSTNEFAAAAVPLENVGTAYFGEVRTPFSTQPWMTGARTYLRFRYFAEGFGASESFKLMVKRADQMNYSCKLPPPLLGSWQTMTVRLDQRFYFDSDHKQRLQKDVDLRQVVWMARSDATPPPDAKFWVDDIILFESPTDVPSTSVEEPE
jgi:hypothetical protein